MKKILLSIMTAYSFLGASCVPVLCDIDAEMGKQEVILSVESKSSDISGKIDEIKTKTDEINDLLDEILEKQEEYKELTKKKIVLIRNITSNSRDLVGIIRTQR